MKLELSGCKELSRKIDRVTNCVPPAVGATSRMSRRHYGLLSHERRTRYPHGNGKPTSPDFKRNRFSSRLENADEYKLRKSNVDSFDHAVWSIHEYWSLSVKFSVRFVGGWGFNPPPPHSGASQPPSLVLPQIEYWSNLIVWSIDWLIDMYITKVSYITYMSPTNFFQISH